MMSYEKEQIVFRIMPRGEVETKAAIKVTRTSVATQGTMPQRTTAGNKKMIQKSYVYVQLNSY